MQTWTWRLKGLFNLFLESPCPLCQRSTADWFCQDCQRQVRQCQLAEAQSAQLEPFRRFAWGCYSGALKRTIALLKYENQPQLAQPLGHWLAQAWLAGHDRGCHLQSSQCQSVVVPIPMHVSKKEQRGYDQAELLAQSFCRTAGLPLKAQGLERIHTTTAQFGLSPTAREQNLMRAFRLGVDFQQHRPTSVLLLDDIYTTGATARSATQTLHRAGIRVQGILTIAAAKLINQ